MSDPENMISRNDLYAMVWTKSFVKLAWELGYSYLELVAICADLNIPRPSGGYWHRRERGVAEEQTALPRAPVGKPIEIPHGPRKWDPEAPPVEPEVEAISTEAEAVERSAPKAEPERRKAADDVSERSDEAGVDAGVEKPEPVKFTREQLYKAIWTKSCVKLAAELGISDVALAKTCRRLGVPRPLLGYWARIEAGEKLPKERLPAAKEGQDVTVSFDVAKNIARREKWALNGVLTGGKGQKPDVVELRPEGVELHPLAEKHRRALEKAKPGELGFVAVSGKDLFSCEVSTAMVPKLVRALDAMICELDDRDYEFEPGDNEYEGLQITKGKDHACLSWSEAKVEIEREPTDADKRKPSWTWQLKETMASGELSIEVSAMGLRGKRKWTEGDRRSLEDLLGVIVEKVEATFRGLEEQRNREAEWAKQRAEAEKRAAEERAREAKRLAEEEKERKERERIKRHEAKLKAIAEERFGNLTIAAQQWIEAQGVTAFIEFCADRWRKAGGGELSKEQLDWLAWAKAEAGRMGPFAKGYPDPAVDGKLDVKGVPVGGPYPQTRALEDDVAEEVAPAAPEVKTQQQEPVRPPEQFPFWLLHRRR